MEFYLRFEDLKFEDLILPYKLIPPSSFLIPYSLFLIPYSSFIIPFLLSSSPFFVLSASHNGFPEKCGVHKCPVYE
jgi:hypothetical protein